MDDENGVDWEKRERRQSIWLSDVGERKPTFKDMRGKKSIFYEGDRERGKDQGERLPPAGLQEKKECCLLVQQSQPCLLEFHLLRATIQPVSRQPFISFFPLPNFSSFFRSFVHILRFGTSLFLSLRPSLLYLIVF